jgi:hypothetical protein
MRISNSPKSKPSSLARAHKLQLAHITTLSFPFFHTLLLFTKSRINFSYSHFCYFFFSNHHLFYETLGIMYTALFGWLDIYDVDVDVDNIQKKWVYYSICEIL